MFPILQNWFLVLKKTTIPYLQQRLKFNTVTALADRSIPSDVHCRSKRIFKKYKEITFKIRCFCTLHFLPGSSLDKDQKTQVTKTCYLPAMHPTAPHQMLLFTFFLVCSLLHNVPEPSKFLSSPHHSQGLNGEEKKAGKLLPHPSPGVWKREEQEAPFGTCADPCGSPCWSWAGG